MSRDGCRFVLDVFCGRGGWARGLSCVAEVLGVDNDAKFAAVYPGHFMQADARSLTDRDFSLADFVVMSPPCEEFARAWLPWLRGDHSPNPEAVELLSWAVDVSKRFPGKVLVECSKFAARHVPGAVLNGSWALWGAVPLLLPDLREYRKQDAHDRYRYANDRSARVAEVPRGLVAAVAGMVLRANR